MTTCGPQSRSKLVPIIAVVAAIVISSVDAATFKLAPDDWLVRVLRYPAFPGVFGAWMLNLAVFGQHSVTSTVKELFFSFPFNLLCWWLVAKFAVVITGEGRGGEHMAGR